MDVELRYFDDCPNWKVVDEHLRSLAPELGFELRYRLVKTAEEAEELSFLGSPSIIVDGRDLFARGGEPVGLCCRLYSTPDGPKGSPTLGELRSALS